MICTQTSKDPISIWHLISICFRMSLDDCTDGFVDLYRNHLKSISFWLREIRLYEDAAASSRYQDRVNDLEKLQALAFHVVHECYRVRTHQFKMVGMVQLVWWTTLSWLSCAKSGVRLHVKMVRYQPYWYELCMTNCFHFQIATTCDMMQAIKRRSCKFYIQRGAASATSGWREASPFTDAGLFKWCVLLVSFPIDFPPPCRQPLQVQLEQSQQQIQVPLKSAIGKSSEQIIWKGFPHDSWSTVVKFQDVKNTDLWWCMKHTVRKVCYIHSVSKHHQSVSNCKMVFETFTWQHRFFCPGSEMFRGRNSSCNIHQT